MQAPPRNARINVEDVYHVVATIDHPPYLVSRPMSAHPSGYVGAADGRLPSFFRIHQARR